MIPIKRVLISVSNKSGIPFFARELHKMGCEIISTGGTGACLKENDIPFTEISSITGNPEAFDGRVKTISFAVAAALLFDRDKHTEEAEKLGIFPIDMVVCNLYPFKEAKEENADFPSLVEHIDIGGPTLIRSAAKNFRFVASVTDRADYQDILQEMRENNRSLSRKTLKTLMRKAFNLTADYDSYIATCFDEYENEISLRIAAKAGRQLRYGENSHQKAIVFETDAAPKLKVYFGKELSFNNYLDLAVALSSVRELERCGCSIIKHCNPCGYAEGNTPLEAFELAWQGDPVSAFGSIIAFNRFVNLKTVKFLELDSEEKDRRKFIEVILAPEFDLAAIEYLKNSKNLRIIEFDRTDRGGNWEYRFAEGWLLKQEKDRKFFEALDSPEGELPSPELVELAGFGLKSVKHLKSNAISIVRRRDKGVFQLIGMGAGQPNRLESTRIAISKSRSNLIIEAKKLKIDPESHVRDQLSKAVLASDAFFPFTDSIDACHEAGIVTIIQPGGSIRDQELLDHAKDLGITVILSGIRHFKH